MIDTHTHILPGIDDGATNLDESLNIARELVSQGITKVIATPHFINGTSYQSPVSKNHTIIDTLRQKLQSEKIELDIYLGNEVYIDDKISELLKSEKITTLAGGKYLMVELPMSGYYPNAEDILTDLIAEGYQIILAHPERYSSIQNDFKIAENLFKKGILFQCEFGSYVGKYGRKAKKTAIKLAKNKMIFAFGSDSHRPSHNSFLTLALKKLEKLYDKDELKQVLILNPEQILQDPNPKTP